MYSYRLPYSSLTFISVFAVTLSRHTDYFGFIPIYSPFCIIGSNGLTSALEGALGRWGGLR